MAAPCVMKQALVTTELLMMSSVLLSVGAAVLVRGSDLAQVAAADQRM